MGNVWLPYYHHNNTTCYRYKNSSFSRRTIRRVTTSTVAITIRSTSTIAITIRVTNTGVNQHCCYISRSEILLCVRDAVNYYYNPRAGFRSGDWSCCGYDFRCCFKLMMSLSPWQLLLYGLRSLWILRLMMEEFTCWLRYTVFELIRRRIPSKPCPAMVLWNSCLGYRRKLYCGWAKVLFRGWKTDIEFVDLIL